jgi:caa(3)-type oxidase subunit IV
MATSGTAHRHPNYVVVWYWLIGLALVSVFSSALPIPHELGLVLIFAAALVKVVLVALYYMHLRFAQLLIYALVIVPLASFFVLVLVLFADITFPSLH